MSNKQKVINLLSSSDEANFQLGVSLDKTFNLGVVDEIIQIIGHYEIDRVHEFIQARRILKLEAKPLDRIPKSILAFKRLQAINFHYTKITEIPSFLAELENLERIYMIDSDIKHLPSGVTFPKVTHLTLDDNPLESLDHIGCFPNLTDLSISRTKVTKLPEEFYTLKELKHLWVYDTPLEEKYYTEVKKYIPKVVLHYSLM